MKRIQSHRGVEGILIINNDGVALKSTMTAEQTSQYSAEMSRVRSAAQDHPHQFQFNALPSLVALQLCAMARSSVRTLDVSVSAPHPSSTIPPVKVDHHCTE
jgi:hypothetical protein